LLPTSTAVPLPVRGAVHIHTRRSDGTGSIDDVAAAAARAGLQFIIVTDHGDGLRGPEPPQYRRGVLCIDAVEISADDGHLVALGLPRAPYPIGGEARDVVEDVKRMGGMAIAAHPSSPKPELRWNDWNAPLDGLEWLNGDSEWRDESLGSLARALLTYPIRRPETLGSLLDRPEEALRRWDTLSAQRPMVALAAADAHARIGLWDREPYDSRISLHVPGYEQVFRAFSISLPQLTLGGDASQDARNVLDAIRHGHVYSSIDALARPVALSFTASGEPGPAQMGDVVPLKTSVALQVTTNAPDGATVELVHNGRTIATASTPTLERTVTEAGTYRIEIQLSGAPGSPAVPWVVSNPIYIGSRAEISDQGSKPSGHDQEISQYTDGPPTGWRVENSLRSQGALDVVAAVPGTQLSLRYAIGGTREESPFVALIMRAGDQFKDFARLIFTARSSRPVRISVQLRTADGSRWHRSVFVDDVARTITVPFAEMTPRGSTNSPGPILAAIRDVLFVVDTVNTRPGTSGQLWIDDVKYGR
jgi:hypothetical protein